MRAHLTESRFEEPVEAGTARGSGRLLSVLLAASLAAVPCAGSAAWGRAEAVPDPGAWGQPEAVADPAAITHPGSQQPETAAADTLTGFSASSSEWQREYERRLRAELSAARIEEHLRWLSSRPHRTGSEGARVTAEYVRDRLQEAGFAAEIASYDAWLTAPVAVSIELVEPLREVIPTTEERIEGDPFTEHVAEHPGWNGYSASGDVTAQVVYAHYGSTEDLLELQSMGVDLEGKILLIRYFGSAGSGRKVYNAERFGAAGVILYADPAEDGFPYGLVYPDGNWRPAGGIMRRSVEFTPFSGDPLSPGWASVPGGERLSPEEVRLPGIPVAPVSYRSAQRILSLMAGPPAPVGWQGRLPLTYRIGPGPARLRLKVEMDNRDMPMLDVVARLEGEVYPDEWVMVGNHHDAWIFGAGDPSNGTAVLLELARAVGELARQGYRPRRTLIVGIWDAEEMLLGGSTEWAEDHAGELLEKAVACINMDAAVFNTERPLSVAAHTTLHTLFREVARDLRDPRTGNSLFTAWTELQREYFKIAGVDGFGEFYDGTQPLEEPWLFEIPSDDAGPFYDYLALPASDMYYGADYGMYHSIYENFHWVKTVLDPSFEYHVLMAQLQGHVALRLANADVPPLDYANEAVWWRMAYDDLASVAGTRGQEVPHLAEASALIDEWEREARLLRTDLQRLLADASWVAAAADRLAELGRRSFLIARHFYRPEGTPARPWNRNLFAGFAYDLEGVSGSTLPGIRFALDEDDPETAAAEARVYLAALQRRVEALRELRADLTAAAPR